MDIKSLLEFLSNLFGVDLSDTIKDVKSNESAINDDLAKKIKDTFTAKSSELMSVEAAKNNPELKKVFREELFPELKGEILGNIDSSIMTAAKSLFGTEKAKDLEQYEKTQEKIKKFIDLSNEILKNKFSEDDKKHLIDDYKAQIEKLEQANQQELDKIKNEFTQKESEFHSKLVKNKFTDMARSVKWKEPYQKEQVQNSLIEAMFNEISRDSVLKLTDSGDIEVYHKDNPDKLKFDGNKKVVVKEKLEKLMADNEYIDLSSGGGKQEKRTFRSEPVINGKGLPDSQRAILQNRGEYLDELQ